MKYIVGMVLGWFIHKDYAEQITTFVLQITRDVL